MNDEKFGRRDLLKRATLVGAGLGVTGTTVGRSAIAAAADTPLAAKVPTRVLGATGEKIPVLLMGGAQKFDPTYDRMLHRAFKDGMFYIDTAEEYANGQSHVTLKPFIEQVGRDNLWITSKSGMFSSDEAPPEMYLSYIEKEFEVLGTDHIDMYFMHGIKSPKVLEPEYIKMGQDMIKRGLTKYFGFSCHDGNVVELLNKAAKIGTAGIHAIMFRYNFTMYGDLELNKAMDACVKAGIGLIAMKTQTSVPQDSEMVKRFQSENFTLFQARLKAAWADERISACVSGISNIKILRENVNAAKSAVQLSMNEYMQLHRYAAETAAYRCQGCNHLCEPRVAGDTKIADTLRYLMYAECYGNHEEARQRYRALSPAERQLHGLDFAAATEACPQGIDIPARLETARKVLA